MALVLVLVLCLAACGERTEAAPERTPPSDSFPLEYSLSRPLLRDDPDALLAGEDWQGMVRTEDLEGYGFYVNKWQDNASGRYADASTVSVPYRREAKRAEIVDDPTFVRAVRLWQTDRSDGDEHTVYYASRWPGVDRCWLRVTVKYQRGFTTAGPGGGASAWKMVFGPAGRSWVWTNRSQMQLNVSEDFGGTRRRLPGGDPEGWAFQETREWDDEEWWEYVVYVERVARDHFRKRFWVRELTSEDRIVGEDTLAGRWRNRWGTEEVGGSVPRGICNHVELGVNRNKLLHRGQVQWWMWGPWEVIDGEVIPDPYGLASDMLDRSSP